MSDLGRVINLLVCHCSDSDRPEHDNVETIRTWHLANGWKREGYHFIITKDGVIHHGRPLHMVGAHVKGHNKNSIGICLTGKTKFSQEQFDALKRLIHYLLDKYGLERTDVLGHRDLDPHKTCPNFNVAEKF